MMQGPPTTALCASLASLHLVDKARDCLGDATMRLQKQEQEAPCSPSLPHMSPLGSRTPLPLPPTHPPQPYDKMGLQLHTGVLRVDFQEPHGRSYWRVLALVLLSRLAAFLNQSPRVCGRRWGFPFASHTPCLGALVTIPPRLMHSYHCLEIWAAARVSWLKGNALHPKCGEPAGPIRPGAIP